jgi:hypothetical protein
MSRTAWAMLPPWLYLGFAAKKSMEEKEMIWFVCGKLFS